MLLSSSEIVLSLCTLFHVVFVDFHVPYLLFLNVVNTCVIVKSWFFLLSSCDVQYFICLVPRRRTMFSVLLCVLGISGTWVNVWRKDEQWMPSLYERF